MSIEFQFLGLKYTLESMYVTSNNHVNCIKKSFSCWVGPKIMVEHKMLTLSLPPAAVAILTIPPPPLFSALLCDIS